MPKLVVFRCDEPGCKAKVEVNASKNNPPHLRVSTPEDWDEEISLALLNKDDRKYFCPKHNKNLETQREWRKILKEMQKKAQEEELAQNPPKGGLIAPRKTIKETYY